MRPAPDPADLDPRWQQVQARDAAADGQFFYAVRTTGIYCRPGCPSRTPAPRNVGFFPTAAEAEAAGFRPCQRCHPGAVSPSQARSELISAACRMIEAAETPPRLEDLARRIGLSPAHLHRQFKAATGLTPREWGAGQRGKRLRDTLAEGKESVTGAGYAAGYGSGSRLHAASDAVLGMKPSRFRKGGAGEEIRFAIGQSVLGAILVAQSQRGICAITLGDDPGPLIEALEARFPAARLVGDDPGFAALVAQVVGLVQAPGTGLDLPLDLRGTAFQERVWRALRQIPPGTTLSYAQVAQSIGAPAAVRAVAGACAANPVAIAVPCHRVVRADGTPSGYRWGLERKEALIRAEVRPLPEAAPGSR